MGIPNQEELYRVYRPKVLGYLCGKVHNSADAEDLTEEVFLKVFSHLDTFDDEKASVSTWIFTVTRNTLYDFYRAGHLSQELDETLSDDTDIDGDLCREETLEELADALEALPEKQRSLVLLHYYQGITLKEAARQMGLSYSYAKLLHTDALQRIKKRLDL